MSSPIECKDFEELHPNVFLCPISKQMMLNPVILIADYQTYDKSSLDEWFKIHGNISPITQESLKSNEYIPNLAIKTQIKEYNEKRKKEQKKKFEKLFETVSPKMNTSNSIRLLLCGDCGVGKSSIKKYIEFNNVDPQFIQPTIGIECSYVHFKESYKNNDNIMINITDICGQDRFRCLTRQCYRNIHGVILICSLDCPDSVKNLKSKWSDDIFEYAPDNIYGIVLVNKSDLLYSKNTEEMNEYSKLMRSAVEFANFIGYPIYNTSSVTGEYIHTAFADIVHRIIEDTLMWDMIQHNPLQIGTISLQKTLSAEIEEPCGNNGCMWAIKGAGDFADSAIEKIKKKLEILDKYSS